MLTIGLALLAEALFVHVTHALQIQAHGAALPAALAAKLAAANRGSLVNAMVAGGIVGLISSLGVTDQTARDQLVTMLFFPLPLTAALALGLSIGPNRILALVCLPVVLAIGMYGRRFGPRGSITGMLLLPGYLIGFLSHAAVRLGELGWLVAEIGVGVAVAIAVRFAFFYPRQARALGRTQRSYTARDRKVAALALELLENPGPSARTARRLHRQLIRLNEAALMIDAQLADPAALVDGSSARLLHQRLFDAELALSNIARFAEAMARFGLPAAQHFEARLALRDLIRGDNAGARAHAIRLIGLLPEAGPVPSGEDGALVEVAHRFAGSVMALADAVTEWMAVGATEEGEGAFQPSVRLFGGQLPGSAQVSEAASLDSGPWPGSRIRLPGYSRAAIQVGVAVGAAIAFGDLLSGRRFYWAVIAAVVTLMGTNNTGEQVRKALFRTAGTLVGVVVGSLLVTAVGHDAYWSIVVILPALFFGLYLNRISYVFMVIGVTVMVSQLYEQLGEFSNSLLLLRLEETALGTAVALAVVNLILPLPTRRVVRIAFRDLVRAVGRLAGHASDHLLGEDHEGGTTLRSDARAVDAAYQALTATAEPVRRNLSGRPDEHISQALQLASAARNYSRSLVADTERARLAEAGTRLDIELASATLRRSLDAIAAALTGPKDGAYTRSSALLDQAERRIEGRSAIASPAQLAIRDLKLIDGTFAQTAEVLGLPIADHAIPPAASGGMRIRGRVRGPEGAGVRAALTLITPRGRQVTRVAADAEGGYWLDAPAAGEYVLLISAGSHLPAASGVTVPEPSHGGETVVNVLLAKTSNQAAGTVTATDSGSPVAGACVTRTDARLSGVVVTIDGTRPVPDARITLLDDTGALAASADTDQTGRYTIEGLADGEYTAIISGYPPSASALHITWQSGTVRHDIQLGYARAA